MAMGKQMKEDAVEYDATHPIDQEMKQEIKQPLAVPLQSDLQISDKATKEERCRHFKHLYEFVEALPTALEIVYNEWSKSVQTYRETVTKRQEEMKEAVDMNEKSEKEGTVLDNLLTNETSPHEREGLPRRRSVRDVASDIEEETNEFLSANEYEAKKGEPELLNASIANKVNISEEEKSSFHRNITVSKKTAPAIDAVKDGLESLSGSARRRLIKQNAESVTLILESLNKQLKNQTGYSVNDYISFLIDKLEQLVVAESERDEEGKDIIDALERIREGMASLPDKTLYQAKRTADKMLSDFKVVAEKAKCDVSSK